MEAALRTMLVCGALAVLLAGRVHAKPLQAEGPPFTLQSWTTHNGLPQNSIQDIAPGADGVLHLATTGGLAHFTGERFGIQDVASHPELVSNRIQQLASGPSGELFVITDEGGLFERRADGFHPIPMALRSRQAVNELICDATGALWVATSEGLFRRAPGAAALRTMAVGNVVACAVDDAGVAFAVRSDEARVLRCDPRAAEPVELPPLPIARPRQLIATPAGQLFVAGPDRVVVRTSEGWRSVHESPGSYPLLAKGAANDVVMASRDAVRLLRGGDVVWETPLAAFGVGSGDLVNSLYVDAEEAIWLGLLKHGLVRASSSPVHSIPSLDGTEVALRAVLASRDGTIYARSINELYRVEVRPEGERLVPIATPAVDAFSPARAHALWFANADGLHAFDGERATRVDGWSDPAVSFGVELLESRDGERVYIATDHSLVTYDAEGFSVRELQLTEGNSRPLGMFEDEQGALWLVRRDGLLVFRGAELRFWQAGVDLPNTEVRSVLQTHPDELWLGTYGHGILRYDGEGFAQVTATGGLFEDYATILVPLGTEHVLVAGNRAMARYRLEDLRAVAAGERQRLASLAFTSSPNNEILESNALNEPRYALDREGRYWFPMIDGIAVFDPRRMPPPPTLLRPQIHLATGGADPAPHGASLRLPPDAREVTVSFEAATFAAPRQVLYEYRLAGLDEEWQITDAPRSTLTYRELPPGRYAFEARAALADGPFGPIAHSLTIDVPRTLWERRSTRLGLALTVVAGFAGFMAWRRSVTRRHRHELEERVAERTVELRRENAERRRVEDELRQAGEQLEDKVQTRTVELARALANLERDVARRERLERRLLESEKLEAIGRLAGGLAHDFNNILTAVLGEVDLAEANLARFELPYKQALILQEHLNNARSSSLRAARLTRQLLAYSQQQVLQPEVVDPLRTIREMKRLLERLVGDDIGLDLELDGKARPILIDPGQLEQVIVNLVVNAAESMPQGGRIRIRCGPVELGGRPFTRIEVHDSGRGISAADLRHVFEPFYTTKGGARGLGLASVQGIVIQSGGNLDVESQADEGTTFVVDLPVTSDRLDAASDGEGNGARRPARGKVLLVDDEATVLRVTRGLLARGGLEVIDTLDPHHAIELAKQHREDLALLVTDVVMPGLNGKQLSEQVRTICPEIQVLFISGYSAEVLSERDLLATGAELLNKPFDAQTLLGRVADVLAR